MGIETTKNTHNKGHVKMIHLRAKDQDHSRYFHIQYKSKIYLCLNWTTMWIGDWRIILDCNPWLRLDRFALDSKHQKCAISHACTTAGEVRLVHIHTLTFLNRAQLSKGGDALTFLGQHRVWGEWEVGGMGCSKAEEGQAWISDLAVLRSSNFPQVAYIRADRLGLLQPYCKEGENPPPSLNPVQTTLYGSFCDSHWTSWLAHVQQE